jgi:hypothetical protein
LKISKNQKTFNKLKEELRKGIIDEIDFKFNLIPDIEDRSKDIPSELTDDFS